MVGLSIDIFVELNAMLNVKRKNYSKGEKTTVNLVSNEQRETKAVHYYIPLLSILVGS